MGLLRVWVLELEGHTDSWLSCIFTTAAANSSAIAMPDSLYVTPPMHLTGSFQCLLFVPGVLQFKYGTLWFWSPFHSCLVT